MTQNPTPEWEMHDQGRDAIRHRFSFHESEQLMALIDVDMPTMGDREFVEALLKRWNAHDRLVTALRQAALELGEAANVMRTSLPSLAEVYDKAAAAALASAEGRS